MRRSGTQIDNDFNGNSIHCTPERMLYTIFATMHSRYQEMMNNRKNLGSTLMLFEEDQCFIIVAETHIVLL